MAARPSLPIAAMSRAADSRRSRQLCLRSGEGQGVADEAGWDQINGGKPITLLTYYSTPLATNVMAAVQAMLAQVGINVVPRAVDAPTYNSIVSRRTPDWTSSSWSMPGCRTGRIRPRINVGLNETQIPPAGNNTMRIDRRPHQGAR